MASWAHRLVPEVLGRAEGGRKKEARVDSRNLLNGAGCGVKSGTFPPSRQAGEAERKSPRCPQAHPVGHSQDNEVAVGVRAGVLRVERVGARVAPLPTAASTRLPPLPAAARLARAAAAAAVPPFPAATERLPPLPAARRPRPRALALQAAAAAAPGPGLRAGAPAPRHPPVQTADGVAPLRGAHPPLLRSHARRARVTSRAAGAGVYTGRHRVHA